MISTEQFQKSVFCSGCRETSLSPDRWSEENPTAGHCVVVALVAQDTFGGAILRSSLAGTDFAYYGSHYWNKLPGGEEVDFTKSQFNGATPQLIGELRTRDQLLSNDNTRSRYEPPVAYATGF